MASVTKVQFHNPDPGFLGLCSRLNIIKYYNMLLKKNPKWGQLKVTLEGEAPGSNVPR